MRYALAILLSLLTTPALACGQETDCTVLGDRSYRYYMPDVEGPVGAVFFAHGYRGSAAGAMNNASLRAMADRLGMAFIAFNADGEDWDLANRPHDPTRPEATEFDYVDAVIADVATRIDLDRSRLIATGFSAGGMMTWSLACGMSGTFAGFVPYSGTFWAPVPETCPTPAGTIIHIHGLTDTTVPLEGRAIGNARQGNVIEAFRMYARLGNFPEPSQVDFPFGEGCLVTMSEMGAEPEGGIALCVFDGGHSFSTERVEWAIEQILDGL